MAGVNAQARALVGLASALGMALFMWAALHVTWEWGPVLSVLLAAGADLFRLKLKSFGKADGAAVTLDVFAIFFVLGLWGPQWAVIAACVNTVLFGVLGRNASYKVAFNAGSLMVSTALAGLVISFVPLPWVLVVPLTALTYFGANSLSVAMVLASVSGQGPLAIWRDAYRHVVVQQLTLAAAGFALGDVVGEVGYRALAIALPLPMIHFAYRLYIRANERHTTELQELSSELIATLAAVVDARDAYTFGHSTQVAKYSVAISRQLGYGDDDLTRLERSALLHDIGKLGIPEKILFKPGRLTAEEYEIMKRHTVIGHDLMARISALHTAAEVALNHHERWVGGGYPSGRKASSVDLDSRIVAVADTLDTILSDRPYRRGSTLAEAVAEITRCSGTQFDPNVVEALVRVVEGEGEGFFINSATSVAVHAPQWAQAAAAAAQS